MIVYPGLRGTEFDTTPPPPVVLPVAWTLARWVCLLYGVLALIGVLAGWLGFIL